MKVKHVQELLNRTQKTSKDYVFVETCLSFGWSNIPISPSWLSRLEKLMNKKGIKYQPSWFERLKNRFTLWWHLESPYALWSTRKYKDIFTSTYTDKPNPNP
jgi:hypothetical protein